VTSLKRLGYGGPFLVGFGLTAALGWWGFVITAGFVLTALSLRGRRG
jgi:hypothetical protein